MRCWASNNPEPLAGLQGQLGSLQAALGDKQSELEQMDAALVTLQVGPASSQSAHMDGTARCSQKPPHKHARGFHAQCMVGAFGHLLQAHRAAVGQH